MLSLASRSKHLCIPISSSHESITCEPVTILETGFGFKFELSLYKSFKFTFSEPAWFVHVMHQRTKKTALLALSPWTLIECFRCQTKLSSCTSSGFCGSRSWDLQRAELACIHTHTMLGLCISTAKQQFLRWPLKRWRLPHKMRNVIKAIFTTYLALQNQHPKREIWKI